MEQSPKNLELGPETKRRLLEFLSGLNDRMTVAELKKTLSPKETTPLQKETQEPKTTLEQIYGDFVDEVSRLDIEFGRQKFNEWKSALEKKWPGLKASQADKGIVIEDKDGNALMTVLRNQTLDHPNRDYFINIGQKGYNYPIFRVLTPAMLKRRKEKGGFGEEFEVVQKGTLECK